VIVAARPAPPTTIVVTIPIRVTSAANAREHWRAAHRRKQAQRVVTAAFLRLQGPSKQWLADAWRTHASRIVVEFTRIAPSPFDDDNIRGAFKAFRDETADFLGLPNDRDKRVVWKYDQQRGKPREYAMRITFKAGANEAE
jgi:hypothetical protein